MHQLDSQPLGTLQANCYTLDLSNNRCLLFDPGAEPNKVRTLVAGRQIVAILLTHGHGDHLGAVNDIKHTSDAPVYLHHTDAARASSISVDQELHDGDTLQFDDATLHVVHTPGHTAGQVCFVLPDDRVIVGDTIFEGGPGRTNSATDFQTTLQTLHTILQWPDAFVCYPGHGTSFRLGDMRPQIETFVAREHAPDFSGDAEW